MKPKNPLQSTLFTSNDSKTTMLDKCLKKVANNRKASFMPTLLEVARSVSAANIWLTPTKLMPLTLTIWSHTRIRPLRYTAPPGVILFTKIPNFSKPESAPTPIPMIDTCKYTRVFASAFKRHLLEGIGWSNERNSYKQYLQAESNLNCHIREYCSHIMLQLRHPFHASMFPAQSITVTEECFSAVALKKIPAKSCG